MKNPRDNPNDRRDHGDISLAQIVAARRNCEARLAQWRQRERAAVVAHAGWKQRRQEVLRAVAKRWRVLARDLVGPGRGAARVLARQVVMWCLRSEGWPLRDVVRACGRTSHATAIHAVRRVNNLAATEPELARQLAALTEDLQ